MTDLADLLDNPGAFLDASDPTVRRLAVSACAGRLDDDTTATLSGLLRSDPEPRVRAEAAEVLAERGAAILDLLTEGGTDPAPEVREAVATAFGEIASPSALPWLMEAAANDGNKLVREAAVAALGAVGDDEALPLLLSLVTDSSPQVRRRTVVALSVFDGPDVEAAIRVAREDRNPMVREAAQMVIGH